MSDVHRTGSPVPVVDRSQSAEITDLHAVAADDPSSATTTRPKQIPPPPNRPAPIAPSLLQSSEASHPSAPTTPPSLRSTTARMIQLRSTPNDVVEIINQSIPPYRGDPTDEVQRLQHVVTHATAKAMEILNGGVAYYPATPKDKIKPLDWQPQGTRAVPPPSTTPSEAISNIFTKGKTLGSAPDEAVSTLDCQTGAKSCILLGVMCAIGPENFDRLYMKEGDLFLSTIQLLGWTHMGGKRSSLEPGKFLQFHEVPSTDEFQIGDVAYAKNADEYGTHVKGGLWTGEYFVVVDRGFVRGFGTHRLALADVPEHFQDVNQVAMEGKLDPDAISKLHIPGFTSETAAGNHIYVVRVSAEALMRAITPPAHDPQASE